MTYVGDSVYGLIVLFSVNDDWSCLFLSVYIITLIRCYFSQFCISRCKWLHHILKCGKAVLCISSNKTGNVFIFCKSWKGDCDAQVNGNGNLTSLA